MTSKGFQPLSSSLMNWMYFSCVAILLLLCRGMEMGFSGCLLLLWIAEDVDVQMEDFLPAAFACVDLGFEAVA